VNLQQDHLPKFEHAFLHTCLNSRLEYGTFLIIQDAALVEAILRAIAVSLDFRKLVFEFRVPTTALIGGCLGSEIDEDRSKTRYSMGIAEA
tara:strand:- start:307 stop:579 length:273 start_codon:yes stop_codon:yes gene_type:complete